MIFGLFGGEGKRVAEMIAAARSGDIRTIEKLLAKGVNVNAPEPTSGDTPILAAIDESQWAAAELLLKHSADLNLKCKNGNAPLYLAVTKGEAALHMVKLLLQAGAKADLGPSQGGNAGATPLHIACAIGANGCIESLLSHGASVTHGLPDGATPIHTAAVGGDRKTIELLCKTGASITALNNEKRTPLHNCGVTGNAVAAAVLIEMGADVNQADAQSWTPLLHAASNNRIDVAKLLLDNGADPDAIAYNDGTAVYPLSIAAMNGYDEIVRLLLERGVNVTKKVDGSASPVDMAKLNGHETIAKLISTEIKRQNAVAKVIQGPTKEAAALWKKMAHAVSQLDFDEIEKHTKSKHFAALESDARLLTWSVLGNSIQIQTALDQGANPNKTFSEVLDGISAMYAAVGFSRNFETVQCLLGGGADPNLEWENGATPIFEVLSDNRIDLLKLLIAGGANVNVRMDDGKTPLIQATANRSTSCVNLLLDAGANINDVLESTGFGAFGQAVNSLQMDMALHLLKRGAAPNFGEAETLGLAVAEHGTMALIQAIDAAGGSIIRPEQLTRVAFVGSRNKDCEVLDYLFRHGANLSEENDCQYTPLILSVLRGHTELVRRYAQRGDDLDAQDVDHETALSLAIEKDQPEMIAILREHGAQTAQYPGLSEEDRMLKAAQDGKLGTILDLHDRGGSVNIENDEGMSPIMLATQGGHLGVVRSLFHIGADINHRNKQGQSATAIATEMEDQNLLATMKEFVADDAVPEAMKGIKLGGIHDIGDMMFGRKTHPGKEDIPYDNEENEHDSDDDEAREDDHEDEEGAEELGLGEDAVFEKLDQLQEIVARPYIAAKFDSATLEHIDEQIELIRSEWPQDTLTGQLRGLLGLLEKLLLLPEEKALPALFQAAVDGDLKKVNQLIKAGEDANATLDDGTTVLMKAVEGGKVGVVQALLKNGAHVNARSENSFSALLFACLFGHDDIIKALVAGGADINLRYKAASPQGVFGNNTVLTIAAQQGKLATGKLLIKLGADLDAVTDVGYTPLMAAMVNGVNEELALHLLQIGANPDPDVVSQVEFSSTTSPLALAAASGLVRVVKELIKRQVNLDKQDEKGNTALKLAAMHGQVEIVGLLLKAGSGVDIVDNEGWTALINAAGDDNLDLVKALVKAGADVNASTLSGITALTQAIDKRDRTHSMSSLMNLKALLSGTTDDDEEDEEDAPQGAIEVIKILLKIGANPNVARDGVALLAGAQESDDNELVKLLKKYGATVDASRESIGDSDVDGQPSSYSAVNSDNALIDALGHVDLSRVKELIAHGTDINYMDPHGYTALSTAISLIARDDLSRRNRRDLKEICDLLINQGASLTVEGCVPDPLGMAAYVGDLHLVSAMLGRGAKTEILLAGKGTPLLAAISTNHENCALALIESGANIESVSALGLTVLHGAAKNNMTLVLEKVLARQPLLVNSLDQEANTPLIYAAINGHIEAIQILLRFDAAREIRGLKEMTAVDCAKSNGHDHLAEMLAI